MVSIAQEHAIRLSAAQPSVDEVSPVGELLNVLRRRKRVILPVILVLTGLATVYGWWIEPTYTATATVMIESRDNGVIDAGQGPPVGSDAAARILETQAKVIQSRDVLVAAMEETGAFADPYFAPASEDGLIPAAGRKVWELLQVTAEWLPDEWLAGTGLAATRWLPDEWRATTEDEGDGDARLTGAPMTALGLGRGEPLRALQNEIDQMEVRLEAKEYAMEVFTEDLSVTPSGEANVLSISYSYPDPVKSARFVNAVIDAYVERQLLEKRTESDANYAWLSERLEALQSEVLAAENAIETFRVENELAPTGATALSEIQLADLNGELITTRAERAEIEAKLRLIHDLEASGKGVDSIAEVVASPLIAELREQEMLLVQEEAELATTYGARHPRIKEVDRERANLAAGIRQEVQRIAHSVENELAAIKTREQTFVRELEALRAERALEDQSEVRLRQLEREAAAKRTVYEAFLARHQELKAREGLEGSNVRVLMPARVPSEPSSPSPLLFAVVGFTASAVLGCMLGLLREQLDKSLRSDRQVERALGLPCLGVVPQVTGLSRDHGRLAGYLCGKPRSAYAEGIRALYAAVLVTDGATDPPPRAVLVTSALPGEGKTSTASSLAVLAARAGQKVLLVDFDLRRPGIAREFGLRPHGGVVEVITGRQSLDQVLISNEEAGIDILPVRSSPSDTTALLTSPRIRALLGELRQRYDYIVLDSPPLLAVTDARLLALHTDATVFVVRWERTKVDAATAGLKVLRDAGVRVAGVVLTQVHLKKHARLRYGDGVQYYKSYSSYYRG